MTVQPLPIQTARCSRCQGDYDLVAFFDVAHGEPASSMLLARRYPTCAGCRQTEKDRRKIERRAIVKAHNAVATHARKYGMTAAAFRRRYGWDVQRIAYDIEHAHANTCAYCWQPYAAMGNGLRDVTLDLIDPEAEPYYRTNVRWCCNTCNSQKQRMAPDLWARRCDAWDQWRENQTRPRGQLTLV